jgi:hypothetical protein
MNRWRRLLSLSAGYCHFPLSHTREYFEQVCSERLAVRYKNNQPERCWVKATKHTRNESLDVRVLGLAALHGLYQHGLRLADLAERFAAMLRPPEQPTAATTTTAQQGVVAFQVDKRPCSLNLRPKPGSAQGALYIIACWGPLKENLPSYTELPSTVELLNQLERAERAIKPRKLITMDRLLLIMVLLFVLMVTLGLASRIAPAPIQRWLAFASGLMVLLIMLSYAILWIISMNLVPVSMNLVPVVVRLFISPTRALAMGLDERRKSEDILVDALSRIPAEVLLERRKRIEAELVSLEWKVNAPRIVGLLGPPLAVVAFAVTKDQSWSLYAFVGLAAICLLPFLESLGMWRLRQIAHVLKKAARQNRSQSDPR